MSTWIKDCRDLYGKFLQQLSGSDKEWDPERLENKLAGTRQVGPEQLRVIEDSPDWPYPKWWPRPIPFIGEPVPLTPGKEVESLQDRIKHIEVVSVVLRFIFPKEFGIMSPPVIGLLNLGPGTDTAAQYYRQYLLVLEKIGKHYGLKCIADVDMALWVAAQLESDHDIRKRMQQDRFFQEIRLRNMAVGFGRFWEHSERARLTLAEVLLKHDHVLAALIAARCFEGIVEKIEEEHELTADPSPRGRELNTRVQRLKQEDLVPRDLDTELLITCRNCAIHHFELTEERKCSEGVKLGLKCGIRKEDMAQEFLPEVRQLYELSGGCA